MGLMARGSARSKVRAAIRICFSISDFTLQCLGKFHCLILCLCPPGSLLF